MRAPGGGVLLGLPVVLRFEKHQALSAPR